jgi:hypothetical protein
MLLVLNLEGKFMLLKSFLFKSESINLLLTLLPRFNLELGNMVLSIYVVF